MDALKLTAKLLIKRPSDGDGNERERIQDCRRERMGKRDNLCMDIRAVLKWEEKRNGL